MVTDDRAPATKQDVKLLMEQVGDYYRRTEQKFAELRDDMREWKKEIIHEFHIVAEDMRHDYLGAHKDRIENHENRITRIERHTGLTAA